MFVLIINCAAFNVWSEVSHN